MEHHEFSFQNLSSLYRRTATRTLSSDDRIVIFSDLHLGNGGRNDDFLHNARLFTEVLGEYYLARDYSLILNGDIEELQRFHLPQIVTRWQPVYALFNEFDRKGRLTRIVGNHDLDLLSRHDHSFDVKEAVRFDYRGNEIFIFHGHQTTVQFERYNRLVGFTLRYLANPLKIRNFSVSHDSLKRYRTEERVYDFASSHKLLSIIGHTHRPLFESMSKVDSIKFEIERLCRKYPKASQRKRSSIERSVATYRAELERIHMDDDQTASVASLYNSNLVVPCMFNSGTVVGKRGMTCIEIVRGRIALVHWFDDQKSDKYLSYANYDAWQLPGTAFHRVEIKEDSLDYIFARIKLLSGEPLSAGSVEGTRAL